MKTWEIFRREYVERVRKKSFLIGTLIGPFLIAALAVVPNLLLLMNPDRARPLAVVDLSGKVGGQLQSLLNPADSHLKDGSLRYPVRVVALGDRPLEEVQQELNGEVARKTLAGYLVVPQDLSEEASVKYYAQNASNLREVETIGDSLRDAVVPLRFQAAGMEMDMEGIRKLTRRLRLEPVQIGKDGKPSASGEGAQMGKLAAAYGMVIVLYITFLMWGMSIMRGVVEEKSSRVVEVLLSSVNARQLMTGKVLGIGSVALTQYLVWGATAVAAYFLMTFQLGMGEWVATLSGWTLLAFIGFFVLGYLMFSSYFAALGACCSTDQEAQQMQQLGAIPVMLGFFLSFAVFFNPDTTLATVLSMIPLFAPFIMIIRVSILAPPVWEISLSVALMLAAIWGLTVVAAKIFRVGLLMTGKKPTLPELWRWVRYA
jgi:ABC-2 type transport system permease protein